MCGRTPRVVTRTAYSSPSFSLVSIRAIHRVFLSVFGISAKGIRIDEVEVIHQPPAVVLIPYDPEQRIVYLVEQPRIAPWFGLHAERLIALLDTNPSELEGIPIEPDEVRRVGFPGGRLDGNDPSLLDLARRELREETGFDCPESEFEFIGTFLSSSGNNDERISFYFVRVSGEPRLPEGDGTEDLKVWAVPVETLDSFFDGRMQSIATAYCICLLRQRIEKPGL